MRPAAPAVSPGALRCGSLLAAVTPQEDAPQAVFLLPGFVDPHVRGGGGDDTVDGLVGLRALARLRVRRGTPAGSVLTVGQALRNAVQVGGPRLRRA